MEVKPLLEMVKISKSFSGVKVLQDVSLSVYGGEVMELSIKTTSGVAVADAVLFLLQQKTFFYGKF